MRLHTKYWAFLSKKGYADVKEICENHIDTPYHSALTINFDMTADTNSRKWSVWLNQTQKEELRVGPKQEEIRPSYKQALLSYMLKQMDECYPGRKKIEVYDENK